MSHDNWQDDEVFRDHFEAGVYVCANCDNKLFASGSKFAHKSPWPSFSNTIHSDSVKKVPEPKRPKALRAVSVREATHVCEGYPGLPLGSLLTGRATAIAGAPGTTPVQYMVGS
ncbi:hypothetical protein MRX96_016041 [Rhipicephalus microplus]